MSKIEYANEVVKELKKLGVTSNMEVKEITKNNGVVYTGILFNNKNSNISPTCYVDEAYSFNETPEALAKGIKEMLDKDTYSKTMNVDFIQDFDKVKDKIYGRIVNKKFNENLVDSVPYAQFGDLMLIFYISIENNTNDSIASAMVNNNMVSVWNVTLSDLIKLAYENTERLFPMTLDSMTNLISNMLGDEVPLEDYDTPYMYIVSNFNKLNGAFYLSSKKALLEVGNRLGLEEFNIIPSSVHEFIVVDSNIDENINVNTQLEMVRDVNNTQLAKGEILSYNIYHFDTKKEELTMLNDNTVIPFLY